jgi:ribonuclease HI
MRGKFESTLGDRIRRSLKVVEEWCRENGLNVNPTKTELVLFSKRLSGSELVGKIRLFGKDIELASRVKYLGVILDSKLNWIAHVRDRAQKALTAFWICRNSFGRNWGLTSKAILWIYTAVIRPMICHGCVVWWPRLDIECAKKELGEIQRLVCLCVAGVMGTTATAALETLLNVPPVHIVAKARAYATADRLAQNGIWSKNFWTGHGRIRNLISNPIFDMPRDRLQTEIDFLRRYEVILPERSEWSNGLSEQLSGEGCVGFTDGSKMSEGTGAGIHLPELAIDSSFHLGNHASVFQAEIFAILMGSQAMVSPEENGKRIFICSDSEASIKALMSPTTTSKLVKECKEALNLRGLSNQIKLIWVPGHSNVEGNERADELARLGSTSKECGPEPFVPIPQSLCNLALKDWIRAEHVRHWSRYSGGVHTKRFFEKPNSKWSRDLMIMDRCQIRRVVSAITGHCGLNKHLTTMRLLNNPNCSCGFGEETGLHVICECPKFSLLRQRVLGDYIVDPSKLSHIGPVTLDRFLARTGRFA